MPAPKLLLIGGQMTSQIDVPQPTYREPSHQRSCPRCEVPLAKNTGSEFPTFICPECRGIALPQESFRNELGSEVESIHRARQQPLVVSKCPASCRLMETREFGTEMPPLQFEACPKCGESWLDVGRLADIRQAAEGKRQALSDPTGFARKQIERVEEMQRDGTDWGHGPLHHRNGGLFSYFTGLPLEGFNPIYRFPLWTWILIGCCAGIFVGQQSNPDLQTRFALIPALVTSNGDGWERLFTSMFLHANVMHLLGNLIFLKVFGDNVEDRLGRVAYLPIFILCGVAADLVFLSFHSGLQRPVVGASGAISGLMGAYLILFPHAKFQAYVKASEGSSTRHPVTFPAYIGLGAWFAYQAALAGFLDLGRTAYWAHAGGFAAGVLVALAAKYLLPDPRIAVIARRVVKAG